MAGKTQEMSKIVKRLKKLGFDAEGHSSGHYVVTRDGEPVRMPSGLPLRLPYSPGSAAAVRTSIQRLKHAGIYL